MITVRVIVEIFKAHEAMGSGIMGSRRNSFRLFAPDQANV